MGLAGVAGELRNSEYFSSCGVLNAQNLPRWVLQSLLEEECSAPVDEKRLRSFHEVYSDL
jgi:hypothetical protein